jgi:hypothetical protein
MISFTVSAGPSCHNRWDSLLYRILQFSIEAMLIVDWHFPSIIRPTELADTTI